MSRYRKFSVVSLFSGCGGFDLATEMTGDARVVWANDDFPPQSQPTGVISARRSSARTSAESTLPTSLATSYIGGPPCQDYSVLWLHEGARTARGALYQEYVRFLAEMRPKAFILENVKGLLSANHGEAWALVRSGLKAPSRAMGDEGPHVYYDLSVQVVNFADLGAPQLRERLVVVGTRRDLGIPPVKIPAPYAGRYRTVAEALEDPRNPLPALGTNNHVLHADAPDVVARLNLIPPGGNLDHQREDRGLLRRVRRHRHGAATRHGLRRRERPPGRVRPEPRAQARDAWLTDRPPGLRPRAGARRQPHRRDRQAPHGRARDARAHAAGRSAQAVGIAQGATDYATRYAKERIAFSKPIIEVQAIQFKLADMQTKTSAARELLYKACALADAGNPQLSLYGSMAKLFASDTAMEVTVDAIQVLGGHGYVRDHPLERMMRDAKLTQIYEGTNEIQPVVIARQMRG